MCKLHNCKLAFFGMSRGGKLGFNGKCNLHFGFSEISFRNNGAKCTKTEVLSILFHKSG